MVLKTTAVYSVEPKACFSTLIHLPSCWVGYDHIRDVLVCVKAIISWFLAWEFPFCSQCGLIGGWIATVKLSYLWLEDLKFKTLLQLDFTICVCLPFICPSFIHRLLASALKLATCISRPAAGRLGALYCSKQHFSFSLRSCRSLWKGGAVFCLMILFMMYSSVPTCPTVAHLIVPHLKIK